MGPGYFPTVLGVLLIVLGASIALAALSPKAEEHHVAKFDWRTILLVLGSVVLFGVLLNRGGLVIALAAVVMVSSYASHEFGWKASLINTVVRARTFTAAMDDAAAIVERLRRSEANKDGFRVLGPAPAPLGKLRGEYRAQFLLKSTNRKAMKEALLAALAARPEIARRTTVDVDPVSVL